MDLADHKKTEEALRESEELYRQLAESTEAILWEYNVLADRWTYVAPQAERILGYAPDEWTNLHFWTDHLHPEDRDWASQYCAECTERGEKHVFEYRFLKKEGGITWLRDIVSVEMQDNIPVKLRGFMIDITDRKQAEKALQKSEENLSITLNSIGDAVIAADKNGLILKMNPVAQKLCGWPYTEAKGKPLEDVFRIINSETREPVPDPVKLVLEKGDVVGLSNHTAHISRDGSEYQITDSAAPIKNNDGLITGVILVFSDVTKDYALRKKIQESERRYRSPFSSTIDSVCLHEIVYKEEKPVDYRIIDVNPKYESITGISREKAIGELASELYGTGQPPFMDIYAVVAETGTPTTFETYFLTMNKHFQISAFSPERGKFATVFQDITDRKQMDETLRALAESGDTSRDDIFKFLVRQIAVSQGKRYSFIAGLDEENKNTAYTIASWGDGEFAYNFSYPIEVTPCHKVVNEGISFFPRDLQRLFPRDHLLAEIGAESYWGAPLRSTAGEVIGVLAILDDRPMEESPQTLSLLKSFAARASAEMERRSIEEKYRTLFTSMVQGVVYQNSDGHIISANLAAERILGLTLDQMQGRTSTDPHWRALREDGSVFPGEEHPAMVALQTGQAVKDAIMGVFNPVNNTYTWINVNAVPLFRPGATKPYQVYTTFEDITERRNAEQKVANYTLELEQLNNQLNEEMDKARHMHDRTLPKSLPEVEGLSFAAHYQPAQKLGGDFYDVIRKDNKLIFYLSDVSGHGLDGAMLSVFVKHTIKGYLAFSPDNSISPANILRYLTKQFAQESYPEEYFICIFIGVLDLESMELTYSGAGFQDTPFVRLGSGDKLRLASKGLFITSYLPEKMMNFYEDYITLTPGTTLFFNTDGLTEQSAQGAYYMDRLAEIFFENAHLPPHLLAQAVTEDFRSFNNGSLQGKDDITFLVLQADPIERETHHLYLTSDFGELKILQETVSNKMPGFKEGGMFVTCLIELVANAIEHGNRFDHNKTVIVELSTLDEYIEATVHDQGEGFDWREKIDRPLELDGSEERGRGIAMTRICCDRLFYNEKGNRVTFTVTTREGGR